MCEILKKLPICALKLTWKKTTVPDCKFNFYVNPVRVTPLDERGPQPVVHILIGYITDNVRSPVDPLLEVGERFLHPLQNRIECISLGAISSPHGALQILTFRFHPLDLFSCGPRRISVYFRATN